MTPHEALSRALLELSDEGRRPPCATDPERWTGDDPATHEGAALDCHGCPILTACEAASTDATWGVWAGRCTCKPHTTRKRTA